MKLFEFQGRSLLAEYGVPVPHGTLVCTPEEAREAAKAMPASVLKAQVLTGGRGKAGGIRAVRTPEEAEQSAREILGMKIRGMPVQKLLVVEALDIRSEYYLAVTVDRSARGLLLIASSAGGVDIEQGLATEPGKVKTHPLPYGAEEDEESLRDFLADLFPGRAAGEAACRIVTCILRLFRAKQCSLVEINPLVLTGAGGLVAADAKVVIDDNGALVHPELEELRNEEEYSPDELDARHAGLSFVPLEGSIGCMVNGAGLAMATMDTIKLFGGEPANFLDVGGSSSPRKTLDAFRILIRNKKVKVILINIFGGVTRCDDVARGILMAREQLGISVPMVIRLIGTNEKEGRLLLEKAGITASDDMTEAVRHALELLAQ